MCSRVNLFRAEKNFICTLAESQKCYLKLIERVNPTAVSDGEWVSSKYDIKVFFFLNNLFGQIITTVSNVYMEGCDEESHLFERLSIRTAKESFFCQHWGW